MKRVLFSLMLMFVATGLTFAQEKSVKAAKAAASDVKPDFKKAEQLIDGALTNPETKDDPETWNVAGFIQRRYNEEETKKSFLRQPYDTAGVYNSVLNMCKYFLKCDELAQIPNEKGKVKNKYRKSNAATMLSERGNLINGGIENYNKSKSKEALDFFGTYIDVTNAPMMEDNPAVKGDTLLPQIAYYACLAASKIEDYPSILKYAPYGEDDPEYGKYTMEFTSAALKALGKTDEWIASLKKGLEKYPDYANFFANLVDYYNNNNKLDEAMSYTDEMLSKSPNNSFFLYVKGYLYQNQYASLKNEKNDDKAAADVLLKAIEYYKKAVEADPKNAEAYSNLGFVYCLQAQDYSEKISATTDVNDPKYKEDQTALKSFYEKARPCYEKARELKPEQNALWLQGLYRVYYNLNMGPEFEAIEKLMQ
ncbi:MAG: tetratricopeptide repeat protein [Prevotellaceae bacterium]|jgi:tetratricopeptide (TPR) repeat protein|nr:tetratricopeptide repeat protein [Prevotellaceae bacterium]